MVPQWLANITAPGVAPEDRRRLDLIVYGATTNGVALCCEPTLVSALTCDGQPAHAADSRDGADLNIAKRRKAARCPELGRGGPQRLRVLAAEVGGRNPTSKTVLNNNCNRSKIHVGACCRISATTPSSSAALPGLTSYGLLDLQHCPLRVCKDFQPVWLHVFIEKNRTACLQKKFVGLRLLCQMSSIDSLENWPHMTPRRFTTESVNKPLGCPCANFRLCSRQI